jgi:hypothetical protein
MEDRMLAHRLVSLATTELGNWLVRGSIYMNDSICIVAYNKVTHETKIQYFLDEEVAFDFVNSLNSR